jgi:hypothetical protein
MNEKPCWWQATHCLEVQRGSYTAHELSQERKCLNLNHAGIDRHRGQRKLKSFLALNQMSVGGRGGFQVSFLILYYLFSSCMVFGLA